jgi:hypothetical protein
VHRHARRCGAAGSRGRGGGLLPAGPLPPPPAPCPFRAPAGSARKDDDACLVCVLRCGFAGAQLARGGVGECAGSGPQRPDDAVVPVRVRGGGGGRDDAARSRNISVARRDEITHISRASCMKFAKWLSPALCEHVARSRLHYPPPQGTSTYCVIETTSSEQMYKTHIVPSSLHPVWNESYQVGYARAHIGAA